MISHPMYKKNLVFAAACLGMLLFGIGLITLGSVASDLKIKFKLDEISSGTLFSIMPVGILTGSLLFGPVCDRYGYKLILILASFGLFAGFEGIAYASSLSALKIFIFLFGTCGGIINGATNAVVADISTDAKTSNLSMLGVFFGIGALGMPFVLGLLRNNFSFEQVLAAVGVFTWAIGVFYIFIQFPPSKKAQGFALVRSSAFLKDSLLILMAFFLFFQGSFEAIINNWTTTYLKVQLSVTESNRLYALSLYVLGMTVMRFLTGSIFRSVSEKKMMLVSFIIILSGIILLKYAPSFYLAVTGLILLGAGLAAGFPVMLGITGSCYAERSGTAFSFVLVVSLIGNMLVNYLMGIIAKRYGIYHLTTVAFAELAVMVTLNGFIFKILKNRRANKN
jgi:FHS family glucose/mannose:H+ symporter-like MFS transporter